MNTHVHVYSKFVVNEKSETVFTTKKKIIVINLDKFNEGISLTK